MKISTFNLVFLIQLIKEFQLALRDVLDILGLKGPDTLVQLSVENQSASDLATKNSRRVIALKFQRNTQDKPYLSGTNQNEERWVPLGHAIECPASTFYQDDYRQRLNLPKEIVTTKKMRVGVCVVVECNSTVLVTRRPATMRTFPLKWVFPGGHVNVGETFEQAGMRELEEETGLKVAALKLLAMWESCYPTYIEQGVPIARHLVLYFLGRLLPAQQQQYPCTTLMRFSPQEIDMAAWLSGEDIESILSHQNADAEIDIIMSSSMKERDSNDNKLRMVKGRLDQFFVKNDKAKRPIESLALGSVFVLQKWLETKKHRDQI
jgi:mutator protein MutT